MAQILVFVLVFYKKHISPVTTRMFGNACRFTPTCSEYTIEALKKHGFSRGLFAGLKRVFRCSPFGGSGFDPVK